MTNNFSQDAPVHSNSHYVPPKNINPYDIYWADLQMHDGSYKERPVLVIAPNDTNDPDTSLVMPITSKFNQKSGYISKQYAPIESWKQSGLSKPSYVDCYPTKAVQVNHDKLNDRSHFAKPDAEDIVKINNKLVGMYKEFSYQKQKQQAKDLGLHY